MSAQKVLKTLILAFVLLVTVGQCGAIAQADSDQSKEQSGKSEKALDSDSLFGGIDFVKGMEKTKAASTVNNENADEIEGEVTVTTNPYNSIQKPTGMVFGQVYEPDKNGKPQKNSANVGMVSGLTLLMGAMQASSQGK